MKIFEDGLFTCFLAIDLHETRVRISEKTFWPLTYKELTFSFLRDVSRGLETGINV